MKKGTIITILAVLILLIVYNKLSNNNSKLQNTFDYKIIHIANKEESNYLISPYSIAYALSILKEGANEDTKAQIENVLENYDLKKVTNYENRISLANALFIKDEHKNAIKETYVNNIKNNYNGEILFDKFETPQLINNWVSEKTFKMINNAIDSLDNNFVLGIINTLAIDVEWKKIFESGRTYKQIFNNLDNTKVNVDMMNATDTAYYIENKNAKGIILDYKKYGDNELEFIAILPNNNIKDYINNFNNKELTSLLNSKKESNDKLEINITIPKFKYDYDYNNIKNDLIELGIKDAFDVNKSNLKNIEKEDTNLNLYVSQFVHKTHIDVNEEGTKASAVTAGIISMGASIDQKEVINMVFDKPFLYIIKDKNSDNIWFFGTVYNLEEN